MLPIQYLRGIAAMMVVFHHIKAQIPDFEGYLPGSFGASGEDVFFVISGFIMYITTARSSMRPGEFMLRRMIRVAPLYWLLTVLMRLIWWMAPSLFKPLVVTPATFFKACCSYRTIYCLSQSGFSRCWAWPLARLTRPC